MTASRAKLITYAANAASGGAPVQIFGARGMGKRWLLDRTLSKAGLGPRRIHVDLARWAALDPAHARREFVEFVVCELALARAVDGDDPRGRLSDALREQSSPIALVIEAGELLGSAFGNELLRDLVFIIQQSANARHPWRLLRLFVLSHAPLAALARTYDPYAFARTFNLELFELSRDDGWSIVDGAGARNWRRVPDEAATPESDDLEKARVEATGGSPLLLRLLAEASSATSVEELVAAAPESDGPLAAFLRPLEAAIAQRPRATSLIRSLSRGTVLTSRNVSPGDHLFLASWGLVGARRDTMGSLALASGLPAVARWARQAYG